MNLNTLSWIQGYQPGSSRCGNRATTDLGRGNAEVVEVVEAADEVWLPFIVLGELRAGFAVGSQGPRNEAILRRFLLKPGVDVLYADEQTTHHYGNVYRQLRNQGTPIPTKDM